VKKGEIMINAPHDKEFVFHDGTRARNLSDLVSKLEGISDHEFHYFVNHHKNDFANWTDHVLSDKHFAEKLRTVDSREDTIHLIKDKINETTIGNSIIRIPRLEDHSSNHTHGVREENNVEHHMSHEHHSEHIAEQHVTKHLESHLESHSEPVVHHAHEQSEKLKAGHSWFKLFSKKDLSKKKLEKAALAKEDKFIAETSPKNDLVQNERENALWIILYFALVLLIITLLIYKLFL
jgi:hypothetical protein